MTKQATRHETGTENLQILATVTLQDALRALGLTGDASEIASDVTV